MELNQSGLTMNREDKRTYNALMKSVRASCGAKDIQRLKRMLMVINGLESRLGRLEDMEENNMFRRL